MIRYFLKFFRIRRLLLSINRRFFIKNYPPSFNPPSKRIIVSPGGVGTTFLINYVSQWIAVNNPDDLDGLKHIPRIPIGLSSYKVLYIAGDSEDIVRSIERRGWLHIQSAKLGCVICQFLKGSCLRYMFKRTVEKQIHYFKSMKSDNILVIDYEDLWLSKDKIVDFFELPDRDRFNKNFPKKRPRVGSGDFSD